MTQYRSAEVTHAENMIVNTNRGERLDIIHAEGVRGRAVIHAAGVEWGVSWCWGDPAG